MFISKTLKIWGLGAWIEKIDSKLFKEKWALDYAPATPTGVLIGNEKHSKPSKRGRLGS
jgi:hypothetical protein